MQKFVLVHNFINHQLQETQEEKDTKKMLVRKLSRLSMIIQKPLSQQPIAVEVAPV